MNNHVGYNHHLSDIRNLALGTDGIGSDMFEEMKFAFFKHRDAGGPLWPDSFAKALANGNELMSRNFLARNFGLLEAGLQSRFNHLRLQLADAAAGRQYRRAYRFRYGLRQRSQRDGQWCDGL